MTLDALSLAILDLEERFGVEHTGRKDEAIHRELRIRPARYYQLLLRLCSDPEALERNPQALRRVRDHGTAALQRYASLLRR